MGYKSSQTIAAISWKTLHTIMKKNIFSIGEYLQAEPMLSRIHSNEAQTNRAEVTKVLCRIQSTL